MPAIRNGWLTSYVRACKLRQGLTVVSAFPPQRYSAPATAITNTPLLRDLKTKFGEDRRPDLLDQSEQGPPQLSRLQLGVAEPLRIVRVQHLVAQVLQVIVVDVIELHPKLKHGNRNQLRRFLVAGRQQRSPALLQGGENRKRLIV
jgi:hypothetical protein